MKRRWLSVVLIIVLLAVLITLLIRAHLIAIDFAITLPADFDVIMLVTAVSVGLFAAIGIVFRKGMERLRLQSVAQARAEAFGEHHRFLSRLDHELKNPLMALRAGLVNLNETLTETGQKHIIVGMETQILRLSRLITDLRKLAELETLPPERFMVDINQLLEEVWSIVHEHPDAQKRRLVLDTPHMQAKLSGDHDLLLLALHNLLDNAFKFTKDGDTVSLKAEVVDGHLSIEVTDTGMGIPESENRLVWEELYRGEHAGTIAGNGIGLALVQAIVQRHGGEASISSYIGEGTKVTLRFPVT